MSVNNRPRKRIARPLLVAAAGASVLLAQGCIGGSGNLLYRPPADLGADLSVSVDQGTDQAPPTDGRLGDGDVGDGGAPNEG